MRKIEYVLYGLGIYIAGGRFIKNWNNIFAIPESAFIFMMLVFIYYTELRSYINAKRNKNTTTCTGKENRDKQIQGI
jgi:hypothetical protein